MGSHAPFCFMEYCLMLGNTPIGGTVFSNSIHVRYLYKPECVLFLFFIFEYLHQAEKQDIYEKITVSGYPM